MEHIFESLLYEHVLYYGLYYIMFSLNFIDCSDGALVVCKIIISKLYVEMKGQGSIRLAFGA